MTAPLHVGVVYVAVVPLVPVIPKWKVMLDGVKPGAAAYTFVAVDDRLDKEDSQIKVSRLGIKVPLPEPYDSVSDLEKFEVWLAKLIGWFQLYDLDIDKAVMDKTRLKILGQNLKDKAATYYRNRESEIRFQGERWTFSEAVLDLRDRFLHKATKLCVASKFENISQGSHDVQSLVDELRDLANRMVERPSDYQLKRRFLQALQPNITKWVVRTGNSPENVDMATLVNIAKSYEESEIYNQGFQHSSKLAEPNRARHFIKVNRPQPNFSGH